MNIQRDTEYRYGEMVQGPKYQEENSEATISSVIITQGNYTTSWPESGWKEIDGTSATVTVTGTNLNADNLQLFGDEDEVISWSTITDTNATGFVDGTVEFKLTLNGEQYGGQVSFSGQ